jgi:DNA-binding XRE family transcriptional regulator
VDRNVGWHVESLRNNLHLTQYQLARKIESLVQRATYILYRLEVPNSSWSSAASLYKTVDYYLDVEQDMPSQTLHHSRSGSHLVPNMLPSGLAHRQCV